MPKFKQFVLSLIFILLADAIWLGLLARNLYQGWLTPFATHLNLRVALAVYLLLALGLVAFVFPNRDRIKTGWLFGLVVYGVYDLSNLSTLRDWSWQLTVVDIIWGSFLMALTSFVVSKLTDNNDKKIKL